MPLFSFAQINPQPTEFKKVAFTYLKSAKYTYDTKGIYGNGEEMKKDFSRATISFDTVKNESFIAFSDLTQDEKTKLMKILYQNTEMVYGVYDVKKNKTTLKHVREDINLKLLFKSVSNSDYPYLDYEVVYDYDKNLETNYFPKQKSKKPIFENRKMLTWLYSDVNTATYLDKESSVLIKNTVVIDENLNQYVNPLPLFDNCVFGVKKLETPDYIMTLQTVSFE